MIPSSLYDPERKLNSSLAVGSSNTNTALERMAADTTLAQKFLQVIFLNA